MAEVRHLCGFLPYLFGVFFVVFIYLSMWLVVIIRGDNFLVLYRGFIEGCSRESCVLVF